MRLDSVVTTVLVLCAVATTALVVRREFVLPSATTAMVREKPVSLDRWRSHLAKGVRLGPQNARVQLIEFADFECPFCSDFHKKFKELRARYPTQVALTFVEFPLPGHRFALPAARVAECAGAQDRFEPMYDLLFEQQDRLGLKPWTDFATEAGVPDIGTFDACIKSTAPIPRVEAGIALGKKLNIQGTPTLIINGWLLPQPPALEELDRMVKAILAGKSPVAEARRK